MIVSQFGVESWMDQYEEGAKYNITDTCAKPLSLAELFSLAGEDRTDFMDRFFEREQTYGTIFGSEKVKKEISRLYESISPEEILTEHGATGGNQHIFFSLIRPGDRVIAFSPSYQQSYSAPDALAAEVGRVDVAKTNHHASDSMTPALVKALAAKVWVTSSVSGYSDWPTTMRRLADRAIYPDERIVCSTYYHLKERVAEMGEAAKADVAPESFEPNHVVVTVPAGGRAYTVTHLAADDSLAVRKVRTFKSFGC